MKPVLLDTGFLVALLDASERNHNRCAAIFAELSRPLITCEPVIAEACYLVRGLKGAAAAIFENLSRRTISIPWALSGKERRLIKLLDKYASVPIDLADACLICMAEDFNTAEILTLDSDFDVYRHKGRAAFTRIG